MMQKYLRNKRGFTLIELLVVIGILAVLLAITLIAINPGQQLQQADETRLRSDVNQILSAISQYQVDNAGSVPTGVTEAETEISSTGANICAALVPAYIAELPTEAGTSLSADDCAGVYNAGYEVSATGNRVTVASSQDDTIRVTR